ELRRKPSSAKYYQCAISNYPQGGGWLEEHTDPIANYGVIHTLSNLSDKGVDFESGGLFFREPSSKSENIFIDDLWKSGDVVCFNASLIRHRVEFIDPDKEFNWDSFSGRWTMSPANVSINEKLAGEFSRPYG